MSYTQVITNSVCRQYHPLCARYLNQPDNGWPSGVAEANQKRSCDCNEQRPWLRWRWEGPQWKQMKFSGEQWSADRPLPGHSSPRDQWSERSLWWKANATPYDWCALLKGCQHTITLSSSVQLSSLRGPPALMTHFISYELITPFRIWVHVNPQG